MAAWKPVAELAHDVITGDTTAAQLVEQSLALIDSKQEYKAVIATIAERARARATEIDQLIADGKHVGHLAGVPFIAKDNFLVFGANTTAASNILKGFDAPYQ